MKNLIAMTVAWALVLGALPAAARTGDTARVLDRLKTELKTPASVTFDSHGRLSMRWARGKVPAGEIVGRSATLLATVRPIMWKNRNFQVLETKTEMSRFGAVAYSTISLDGFPVVDQYMKVSTGSDGTLKDVVVSIPADCTGFTVADGRPAFTMEQAAAVIRAESRRFDGLIVPDQVQRVWFMTEDGGLAPGGRMLLRAADLSRLFEAIVDLRTGKLVRFVDIARR